MKEIKRYTVEAAKAMIEANETLKAWVARLRKEDEDNYLDYGNDHFDLCTNIDNETENRVWISLYKGQDVIVDNFDHEDEDAYYMTGLSIEQAILIARDIEDACRKLERQ